MITPKQKDILNTVRRFGKTDGMSAIDIGISLGQPRKRAEKWVKPAIKELIKQKLVRRDENVYKPISLQ